jgi:hypothetical protein
MKKLIGVLISSIFIFNFLSSSVFSQDILINQNEDYIVNLNQKVLTVERHIIQHDNYFEIEMIFHVENLSDNYMILYDINISTEYKGFHCAEETNLTSEDTDLKTDYSMKIEYDNLTQVCYVDFSFDRFDMDCTYKFSHYVVPVLHADWRLEDLWGTGNIDVEYKYGGYILYFWHYEEYNDIYTSNDVNIDIINKNDIETAIKASDYLIVTNPINLFKVYESEVNINKLLMKMAELAKAKNGVLGFLYAPISFWGFNNINGFTSGDLDGDDIDKILTSNYSDVRMFSDFGSTQEIYKLVKNNEPFKDIICADIDGDNDDEILFFIYKTQEVIIYNNQKTKIEEYKNWINDQYHRLLCRDINRDKRDDVVVLKPFFRQLIVYTDFVNDDTKTFMITLGHDVQSEDRIVICDFNGDGIDDVIIGEVDTGYIHVKIMEVDKDGDFIPSVESFYYVSSYGETDVLVAGDIDDDGMDEIIHRRAVSYGNIEIYNYNEPSDYLDKNIISQRHVAIADVDNDDVEEILIAWSNRIEIIEYLNENLNREMPCHFENSWSSFDCGDINGLPGVGDDEIIIANTGEGLVDVNYYEGSRTLSFESVYKMGDSMCCGDVNGDGKDEILIASPTTKNITVYYDGGPWITRFDFDIPKDSEIICGDLDSDGAEEIIIGEENEYVSCYFNLGTMASSIGIKYYKNHGLTCGNIYGGMEDKVIVADPNSGLANVKGLGNLDYNPIDIKFSEGDELICGDVNGDGKDDILVADNTIDVFFDFDMEPYSLDIDFSSDDDFVVCGNVDDDKYEEILVGRKDTNMIDIYDLEYTTRIPGFNRLILADLIKKNTGEWANMIGNHFTDDGYLLIVGETQIIPAGDCYYDKEGWSDKEHIRRTDLHYGNTGGDLHSPELCVGRIIGNSVSDLIIPIHTSLDEWYGTNKWRLENALIYSGYKKKGEDAELIPTFANQIRRKLEGKDFFKSAYWIHCNSYKVGEVDGAYVRPPLRKHIDVKSDDPNLILRISKDNNLSFLIGHGTFISIDVINITHFSGISYNSPGPIIISGACSSGDYAKGLSIAESFLECGAAVFIGATKTSGVHNTRINFREFISRWNYGEPIGNVLRDQKRDHTILQQHFYWNAIFHCYGDPKYGMIPS